MKINFYATLRPIVGKKSVEFAVPEGATVADVLELVVSRYPDLRAELLDEQGHLYRHVHFFVNGRDVPYLENATDTPIRSTDKLDIFPAVGGGC